ncbi:GIN domain-containing protein [Alterisphingorhabdus coralli]|uniref:DUF2807 domain-containing protein n=1 Tax=Alterisphingorhabdus coralli TaxID=3071408 RepID=A0AA97I1Z3_9SPHN|nr:DUF2807 domain-containing protein [Parasphingorhabdus sp. SCSIO 66989]WOE75245.1 DUF2807 domain-containing protein [Parasphingorhabdus sp. SCSIO 66989]
MFIIRAFSPFLLLVMAAGLVTQAQAAERRFTTGNFTSLRIDGDMDVEIVEGRAHAIVAEGENRALSRIRVRTSSRAVTISMRAEGRTGFTSDRPQLSITVPRLNSIDYQSDGMLTVERLAGEYVQVIMGRGGSARIAAIEAQSLVTNMTSSGTLEIAGDTDRHNLIVGGYGQVDAANMFSEETDIVVQGPVEVIAHARKRINGVISEGAEVRIFGGADCAAVQVSNIETVGTSLLCDAGAMEEMQEEP